MTIRSMVMVTGLAAAAMAGACGGKDTSGGAPDAPRAVDADPSAPDANPSAPDAAAGTPDAPTGACGKTLTTHVYIDDTDTAGDLAMLAGVSTIDSVTVSAKNLTTLAGLECLENVTGTIYITQATKLENLDALAGLRKVGGLIMMGNTALTSITPLEGMTQLGGAQIFNNTKMCGVARLKTDMVAKGTNAQYFTYGGNGADNCP